MKIENCKIDNSNKIPRILLVDMNSFFASVEQQANPFFRGKPLGVCASLHDTSCLIAASKEAKAMGIKTGTLVYKARKICPKIILLKAEPEKYREVNRQINRIFLDYTKAVEIYSIDESFLDLSDNNAPGSDKSEPPPLNLRGGRGSYKNPLLIGSEIKQRIRHEVGEWLTCSVGIAPNKFMAKLAADMEKPDGLSIVWRDYLPEIYKHKSLTDLWGISYGWQKKLAKLNITSPLQLLGYPVENLISLFGRPGFFIWQRVNGLEIDTIARSYSDEAILPEGKTATQPSVARGGQKSFGNSWVLNFRTTEKERLKIVVLRLAEKAARRMRVEGFIASGMYLSITLVDGSYLHRSKKLRFNIETGIELYSEALNIWKSWNFNQEVMHIAVGFNYLLCKTKQLSLFPDKLSSLTPTLDFLNDKYGEFTVRSGLLTETTSYAPDAIAFGK